MRFAKADAAAFAGRHPDRRISLREIALSHKGLSLESGVAPFLWEGPNLAAIGPISRGCAEADVVAFAGRHADLRISLCEIALSHKVAAPPAPLWEGPNRTAIGPIWRRSAEA
ncbi:MAG: hypothetical protein JJT88_03785, partial [Gammaproteobacteria bacterium]|nr:hypothetical protein [Gammaproteobacteria bacterium]